MINQTQADIDRVSDQIISYHKRYPNRDKAIKRRREIQYIGKGAMEREYRREKIVRSQIKCFSPASGGRLRRYIDNYYKDFKGMITLTYGEHYPEDGRVVKKHLNSFFERLRRHGYFEKESLVWWMEFQARGAVHIHAVITGWLSYRWCAMAWAGVTNGDVSACTRVERLRDPDAVGGYAAKYAAKAEQKEVPDGFLNVGRFWGCRGGAKNVPKCPKVVAAAVNVEGGRAHMRALVRLYRRVDALSWGKPVKERRRVEDLLGWPRKMRIYEHEGGWSVYGKEKDIQELWESCVMLNLRDNIQGGLTPRMWQESIAMH